MKIQIFGPGCSKCRTLAKNAAAAADSLGLACELEKITDMKEIMSHGILSTPAIAIDGRVRAVGRVVTEAEIRTLLQG